MNKLIEWTLNDIVGDVQRISLVDDPAVESDFMLFSKAKDMKFKVTDKEKRVITGVAMRPNFKIARVDENGETYYGFFSEETVVKACELFFRKGQNTNQTSIDHKDEVDDVFVFESWIVEDIELDKTKALGFSDIKKGDWIVSMKVENDVIWEDFLKKGLLKGFSVEILAIENEVDETEEILNFIKEALKNDNVEETFNKIKQKLQKIYM